MKSSMDNPETLTVQSTQCTGGGQAKHKKRTEKPKKMSKFAFSSLFFIIISTKSSSDLISSFLLYFQSMTWVCVSVRHLEQFVRLQQLTVLQLLVITTCPTRPYKYRKIQPGSLISRSSTFEICNALHYLQMVQCNWFIIDQDRA